MEAFFTTILRWPVVKGYFTSFVWAWPLNEIMHFVGLSLLIGTVGMFDLRLLGFARGMPVASLRQLLPWGIFGFVLVTVTGLMFTTGMYYNIAVEPYVVLISDGFLQLKLIFYFLAGINLLVFYRTGMSRAVGDLGPGEDAPPLAKALAGASLFFWIAVMYFGRLIPFGQLHP